jgi:hypothetical protein
MCFFIWDVGGTTCTKHPYNNFSTKPPVHFLAAEELGVGVRDSECVSSSAPFFQLFLSCPPPC